MIVRDRLDEPVLREYLATAIPEFFSRGYPLTVEQFTVSTSLRRH